MANKKKTTNNEEVEVKEVDNTINNTAAAEPEIDPKVLAQARVDMRAAMKEKFGKWIDVSDEDADDADIQEARDAFEAEVKKYQELTYNFADNKEEALEICQFLSNWNTKYNHWKNAVWRGLISFETVMKKNIDALMADEISSLDLDYQTLMFLYHQMQQPEGVGLAAALEMAELENFDLETNQVRDNDKKVTYTSVLTTVYKHVNMLAMVDKMLNLMRERMTIAAAGIKFTFKITELEEFKELSDAWVVSDQEPNKK